jgi:hypothetical protein
MNLILASASPIRRTILSNAGLEFEVVPADIDERSAEQPLVEAGAPPEDVAAGLAMAKAASVSELNPRALVIGADQILDLHGERFNKPEDMEGARRQLLRLSGRTHELHSAIAAARGGEIVWHDVRQRASPCAGSNRPRSAGTLPPPVRWRCGASGRTNWRGGASSSSRGSTATTSPSSACAPAAPGVLAPGGGDE